MDTLKFLLIIGFAMVTMKLWTSWELAYRPQSGPQQAITEESTIPDSIPGEIPEFTDVTEQDLAPETQTVQISSSATKVDIETDLFRIEIDTQGAGIKKAALMDYPVDIDTPDEPFVLMESSNQTTFISQGGLLSNQPAPTNESLFLARSNSYKLESNQDVLRVPFFWSESGITVTKTYIFTRGSHLVRIDYTIRNESETEWSGRSYHQIKRNNPETSRMRTIYTYTGTVISDPENRYEKITFDEIATDPIARDARDGWIAVIQHYFLTALVPADTENLYHFYTRALGNQLYTSGIISPGLSIAPNDEKEITEQIYIGPKDQEILAGIADGLDLTVDYGKLWFIAKPLFWALKKTDVT